MAVPERNLEVQWQRLTDKFRVLSAPVAGDEESQAIIEAVTDLDSMDSLDELFTSIRST